MPIPFPLDHTIDRLLTSDPIPSLIRTLTGVSLPVAQARAVLAGILEHKWLLSERLGRDVGLKVAAIDYMENVHPKSDEPRRSARGWAAQAAV